MPITFPGDNPFSSPSRQYIGAQTIGGVEKYGVVNGSSVTVSNLNASNITTGTLSADRIGANTITAAKIAAGTITATELASNAVTADKISANAVTASKIAADSITVDKLVANSVTANKIDAGAVTSAKLQSNISLSGLTQAVQMYVSGGAAFGGSGRSPSNPLDVIGNISCGDFILNSGYSRFVFKDSSGNERLSLEPNGTSSRLNMNGFALTLSSNKTAILPTSQGYRSFYCMESPEVWIMDFVTSTKFRPKWYMPWKVDWKLHLDKLFMEVTSEPYHLVKTMVPGVFQIWGKRKDRQKIRMEEMTEAQFKSNEEFYKQAHIGK